VPLSERSALSYYLTGEILRALVEAEGDVETACQSLAGDEDLARRIATRVAKVRDALRASPADDAALRRRFAKLPAGYEEVLSSARRLVAER
jgi:hypothetical protein